MYRVVSIERLGDSVFKNEYDIENIKDARSKYEQEKAKPNVVDIRLWFCTEIERFTKEKN